VEILIWYKMPIDPLIDVWTGFLYKSQPILNCALMWQFMKKVEKRELQALQKNRGAAGASWFQVRRRRNMRLWSQSEPDDGFHSLGGSESTSLAER
jgi:hypothetical protein